MYFVFQHKTNSDKCTSHLCGRENHLEKIVQLWNSEQTSVISKIHVHIMHGAPDDDRYLSEDSFYYYYCLGYYSAVWLLCKL